MSQKLSSEQRRKFRVRNTIRKNAISSNRPRLSIHRTNDAIYAQVIDDVKQVTLASASSLDKDFKQKTGGNVAAAAQVGKVLAERAKKAGVSAVIFDRGQFRYHGRVKALADAARQAGLEF